MTFKEFLGLPVTVGEFRGMIRSSYVRYVCNRGGLRLGAGLKRAKQELNGYFGGWRSQYNPSELEQSEARKFIDCFSLIDL